MMMMVVGKVRSKWHCPLDELLCILKVKQVGKSR